MTAAEEFWDEQSAALKISATDFKRYKSTVYSKDNLLKHAVQNAHTFPKVSKHFARKSYHHYNVYGRIIAEKHEMQRLDPMPKGKAVTRPVSRTLCP